MTTSTTRMTVTNVSDTERPKFTPDMFGPRYFIPGEGMLFHFAEALMPDYDGGLWSFHRVSNGAMFAAPPERETWRIVVDGNYTDCEVSTEAAGIILSMFALGAIAETAHGRGDGNSTDRLADHYHLLRYYACEHPEARAILAAIN
ncbi:hypothetical protein OKW45_001977 [Paraburkholderia sp. WSM4175]|uniref:antirestriction protein n=1 Tax=Paraburkholderia sp. WSM4175 TaxID=2991072 RepID=UPI003D1E1337